MGKTAQPLIIGAALAALLWLTPPVGAQQSDSRLGRHHFVRHQFYRFHSRSVRPPAMRPNRPRPGRIQVRRRKTARATMTQPAECVLHIRRTDLPSTSTLHPKTFCKPPIRMKARGAGSFVMRVDF